MNTSEQSFVECLRLVTANMAAFLGQVSSSSIPEHGRPRLYVQRDIKLVSAKRQVKPQLAHSIIIAVGKLLRFS